jgi:hypothetical protein
MTSRVSTMTDTPINELQGLTPLVHEHVWGTAQCTAAPLDQQNRMGEIITVCLLCFDTRGVWRTPSVSDYQQGRARRERPITSHPMTMNPEDLDLRPGSMTVIPENPEVKLLKEIVNLLGDIKEKIR